MISENSVLLWSKENCRPCPSPGSLRKPARVHGLHSVHSALQSLVISVLAEVDTALDTEAKSDEISDGDVGVRDSERNMCTILARRDAGGEGSLTGDGDGLNNLGAELTISHGAYELT
jgi:hypothetical protein